jgi:DNA-binding XRE family transcriptional regulator
MARTQNEPAKPRVKRKVAGPRPARSKLTGTGRVTTAVGRPPNFERLERFFASQTALARALGVHRDTVRAWEHGDSTRLRHSSIERVNTICAVAEQVTRYLPHEELVGEWLLAPHIGLGGVDPAAFIRREPGAYQRVLRLIALEAQPVSVGDISGLPPTGDLGVTPAELPEPAPDPDADPGFLASLG